MSSQDGPGLFFSLLHIYVNEYKIKKDKKVEAPKDKYMEHG